MIILTIALFGLTAAAIVWTWNHFFRTVPWRIAGALWLLCAAYQAPTLCTGRVDVPASLAYAAYPWLATGRPAVPANTGIVLTQLAPWTQVARELVRHGEPPLWNRMSAAGAPLLANQQTAIFHPFTLLGLLLPLGKAFTLSACLRLFFVAFFTFVLLRNWKLGTAAALFGAIAYAFCSFHVVWLLFPLGLATMMLPLCLVGVQELSGDQRGAAYVALLLGLSLSVLGGHPESALWVWIATALVAAVSLRPVARLAIAASAFLVAMLLTAFWWYPTLGALPQTPRYELLQSRVTNPANHGLSAEWLLPLVAPNILGTPAAGTYAPPRGWHPAVLNDYGEVASGYAGLATLGLALAAPFIGRKRPMLVAAGLMVFSILTFAEVPVWRDLVRAVPLAGISIHQRLRIFWDLGVCIAAATTLDAVMDGSRRRPAMWTLIAVATAFAAIYAVRHPPFVGQPMGRLQFIVPLTTTLLVLIALARPRTLAAEASLLVFLDLATATFGYNPPARPADLYPVTGAIAMLQHAPKPFRFAALGWSFLPDTPSYYGIEDVKTTDPVQNARYMRLLRGYLNVDPGTYDLVIRDVSQPFFDYLNVRYVYAPADEPPDPKLVERYRGMDGIIRENTRVLPRYFLVGQYSIEQDFDRTVWRSREIRDFRAQALVDHVPERFWRQSPELIRPVVTTAGGSLRIRSYGARTTVLDVDSRGWNLMVSSEVNWRGWRAYWNGQRQPVINVNGAFVGVFVPKGKGELVLRYVPREFTRGVRISTATLALLVMGGVILRLRRNSRGASGGPSRPAAPVGRD